MPCVGDAKDQLKISCNNQWRPIDGEGRVIYGKAISKPIRAQCDGKSTQ